VHRGARADLLINANGSSDKRLAAADPLNSYRLNVDAALASLHDFTFEGYLLVSSVDVYSDLGDVSRTEESTRIEPRSLTPYGLVKYMTELVVQRFAPRWTIFRLGPLVGPGLRKNPIFDLLERRTLFMHPSSCLSFIDTRTVADVVWRLRDRAGEVFNVAGEGAVRLSDVAERVSVTLPQREDLPRADYIVSVRKLGSIIPLPTSAQTIERFLGEQRATPMPG
jgi:nucleoside-diphosphate-sugar epimerase